MSWAAPIPSDISPPALREDIGQNNGHADDPTRALLHRILSDRSWRYVNERSNSQRVQEREDRSSWDEIKTSETEEVDAGESFQAGYKK